MTQNADQVMDSGGRAQLRIVTNPRAFLGRKGSQQGIICLKNRHSGVMWMEPVSVESARRSRCTALDRGPGCAAQRLENVLKTTRKP
jgi:hypothetical protein